jgi:hypothetical protein
VNSSPEQSKSLVWSSLAVPAEGQQRMQDYRKDGTFRKALQKANSARLPQDDFVWQAWSLWLRSLRLYLRADLHAKYAQSAVSCCHVEVHLTNPASVRQHCREFDEALVRNLHRQACKAANQKLAASYRYLIQGLAW